MLETLSQGEKITVIRRRECEGRELGSDQMPDQWAHHISTLCVFRVVRVELMEVGGG